MSPLIIEALFLMATLGLGLLYARVKEFLPDWSREYHERQKSTVGAQIPPPRLVVYQEDLVRKAAWFCLPLGLNMLLLHVFSQLTQFPLYVIAILIVEGALGWRIQYRRTLAFARDWLIYRRLTEPENFILEGEVQYLLQHNADEEDGKLVSFRPDRTGSASEGEPDQGAYYFLPVDVTAINQLPVDEPLRLVVRPLRIEETALGGAGGVIVGILPPSDEVDDGSDTAEQRLSYVRGIGGGRYQ
jgi:hypothetical protein